MRRARHAASTPSLPARSTRLPALQWLPPSSLRDSQLSTARAGSEEMLLASYLAEFDEQKGFKSAAVFLEMQLRQALAATSATASAGPDSFRTACVCEALARLPEAAGSFAGVLQLLRTELLRSVYVDAEALARRGRRMDAQGLLTCRTYFAECDALRREVRQLEQRLSDWRRAKDELKQDSDGRNELLRLAVARWNAVLGTVRTETRPTPAELSDATAKLTGLLDSMLQHSRAIDELQRISLLNPLDRVLSLVRACPHVHAHACMPTCASRGATRSIASSPCQWASRATHTHRAHRKEGRTPTRLPGGCNLPVKRAVLPCTTHATGTARARAGTGGVSRGGGAAGDAGGAARVARRRRALAVRGPRPPRPARAAADGPRDAPPPLPRAQPRLPRRPHRLVERSGA